MCLYLQLLPLFLPQFSFFHLFFFCLFPLPPSFFVPPPDAFLLFPSPFYGVFRFRSPPPFSFPPLFFFVVPSFYLLPFYPPPFFENLLHLFSPAPSFSQGTFHKVSFQPQVSFQLKLWRSWRWLSPPQHPPGWSRMRRAGWKLNPS